jgi:hypothetical protein
MLLLYILIFLQEGKAMKNLQCSGEEENVNKLREDSCHLEMGNIKGSRSSEWHLKSQDGLYQTIRIGCDLLAAYVPCQFLFGIQPVFLSPECPKILGVFKNL